MSVLHSKKLDIIMLGFVYNAAGKFIKNSVENRIIWTIPAYLGTHYSNLLLRIVKYSFHLVAWKQWSTTFNTIFYYFYIKRFTYQNIIFVMSFHLVKPTIF